MKYTGLCVFILLLAPLCFGYGEGNDLGYPTWESRAFMTLVNAARVGPTQYRDKYTNDFYPSTAEIMESYTAQPPFYWDFGLVSASQFHVEDLAACGGASLRNDDCDGSSFTDRIIRYCPKAGYVGEVLGAGGNGDPRLMLAGIFCEAKSQDANCTEDGASDSSRAQLLAGDAPLSNPATQYQVIGAGMFHNSSTPYQYFWSVDLGNQTCSTKPTTPVYSGSHIFQSAGKTKFIAVYSGNNPAENATVYINDVAFPLTLDIGVARRGAYVYEEASQTSGNCRQYYFGIKVGLTEYRFPEQGFLLTTNEQTNCTAAYTGPSATTTSVSTTTTTTASATTDASTTTTGEASTTTTAEGTTSTTAGTTSTAAATTSSSTSSIATTSTTAIASTTTSATSSQPSTNSSPLVKPLIFLFAIIGLVQLL